MTPTGASSNPTNATHSSTLPCRSKSPALPHHTGLHHHSRPRSLYRQLHATLTHSTSSRRRSRVSHRSQHLKAHKPVINRHQSTLRPSCLAVRLLGAVGSDNWLPCQLAQEESTEPTIRSRRAGRSSSLSKRDDSLGLMRFYWIDARTNERRAGFELATGDGR